MTFNLKTFWILVLCLSLTLVGVEAEAAKSPRKLYFEAEKAYNALLKNGSKQKYRDSWLQCIEKFQDVYHADPIGPWASAGMFMIGKIYYQLYQASGNPNDKKEAKDYFQRLIRRFPNSGYVERARGMVKTLNKSTTPTTTTAKTDSAATAQAKSAFHQGESCYYRLLKSKNQQKYRHPWLTCINHFQTAYRKDPQGTWAAASLFKTGKLYHELFQHSYSSSDKKQALESYEQVIKKHPNSAYRPRAAQAIADIVADDRESKKYASPGDSNKTKPGKTARKKNGNAKEPKKSAKKATVTGLRFWSNPEYTRLVIDADSETKFSFNLLKKDPSLKKPQRLYVDLHNSRLSDDIQRIIPINDDLLLDARAGQYTREVVRVVADIKSFKSYEVFSLKDPFRIVIDMTGSANGNQKHSRPVPKPKPEKIKIDPKKSSQDLARQLSLGVRRIVVDAGHGGRDYGAPGYLKGVHEKKIALQISKRLARKLREKLKCEVIMTRSGDRFLTLEERTAIANTKRADLFISIHANANNDKRAYGIETYFLNFASDEEAIQVAAKENATSTRNISDLQTILQSLMQNAKINESSRLASHVQHGITRKLMNTGYSRIKDKGVKQAPFYVLLGARMPSVLIETSFISNPRECKRLLNAKYQDALCDGILAGIRKYIKETNPTAFREPSRGKGKSG